MPTLEIIIQRKYENGYPVIVNLTATGGALPLRREGTLRLDPDSLNILEYDPLAYGVALGKALFVEEVRDTFREGMTSGEGLRVLLSVDAPDLIPLDWHRLCAPFAGGCWNFLATQQNTPFSLDIPSPASAHFPAIGKRDLRALVVVAGVEHLSSDYNLAKFDVSATRQSILRAMGGIPGDVLEPPTLDALCNALTARPYTILHIVCHGAVSSEGETILYLPKDREGKAILASDLLGRLANVKKLPYLAYLCACESALPRTGLGSLARRLVRELGLPATVAMTGRVSIATAEDIAAPFYGQLQAHGQPDLALAEALAGLQGRPDLLVPALLSRLGGQPLFSERLERDLTDQELQYGLSVFDKLMPERAPVLKPALDALALRLRSTMGADAGMLSAARRAERVETLSMLNDLSLEALDLSFIAVCLGQTPPIYDSRSPFRGLESFRPEDSEFFFGRNELVDSLVRRLDEHPFLAVLGASGSGKSSLVMAGLIPALKIPYTFFRPGKQPLAELEKAIASLPPAHATGNAGEKSLIVVDQFEELFTQVDAVHRREFIRRLLELPGKYLVVVTMRVDFLGEAALFKPLKDEIQRHQEIIVPMDESQLRRAMEGQARQVGLRFEADLSQQMLDDVTGEPGAMPLLQHALWELWKRRRGRWLRADEYRAFGGVRQAIAGTAEEVYAHCSASEQDCLEDIFMRLTRLDEGAGGRDTRRRVLVKDLVPSGSDPSVITLLLQRLADARLVVINNDEVEVAHEALIHHWGRLHAWLNDDRDNLRLREVVSDSARQWENAGKDDSMLIHRGARLELALRMSKLPRYRLNPTEQAYLDACVASREREMALGLRRRRIAIAGILAATLVIMAVLAGWAITSTNSANEYATQVAIAKTAEKNAENNSNLAAKAQSEMQKQIQVALSRQLASQAITQLNGNNSDEGLLLAIQAGRVADTAEASTALRRALSKRGRVLLKIPAHQYYVNNAVWNRDNSRILTYGCEQWDEYCTESTARVWDAATGAELVRLSGFDQGARKVIWNADESRILTAGEDGIARVWDAKTGKELMSLKADLLWVSEASWNEDESRILTIGAEDIGRVWDAHSGALLFSLTKHEACDVTAFWNPDESLIVTTSDALLRGICAIKGSTWVWDAETGQALWQLPGEGAVMNADGSRILTLGDEGSVWVLDPNSGELIKKLSGHTKGVVAAVWNAAESQILTSSDDGTARVWDGKTGEALFTLSGHTSSVVNAWWNSAENWITTTSYDGTTRIWDARTGRQQYAFPGDSPLWSPDENRIITVADKTTHIWDANTGEEILTLASFGNASWSKDGGRILSVNEGGFVRVWDARLGIEPLTLTGHTAGVYQALWNAGESRLLSAGEDGTVRVWEAATGAELFTLSGDYGFWSNDEGRILTAGDGEAWVWDAATGEKLVTLVGHTGKIAQAWWSRDESRILTASYDGTARIWDASTGREVLIISANELRVWKAVWNGDESLILTMGCDRDEDGVCIEGSARVWDAITGEERLALVNGLYVIWDAAWDRSGTRVLIGGCNEWWVPGGCVGGAAQVWDIQKGNPVLIIPGLLGWVTATWNQDESRILTRSDNAFNYSIVEVWDAKTGSKLFGLEGHTERVNQAAWNATENRILTAGDDGVARVWDAVTGDELFALPGITAFWNADGNRILTAGADGTIHAWEVQNGGELFTLAGHTKRVWSAQWDTDENRIVSAGADGDLRIWRTGLPALIKLACQVVTRNLTVDEWQQFIGDILPYQAVCPSLPVENEATPTPTP